MPPACANVESWGNALPGSYRSAWHPTDVAQVKRQGDVCMNLIWYAVPPDTAQSSLGGCRVKAVALTAEQCGYR